MHNCKYWTPEEIADIFTVHVVTVRRWIAAGQLGAIRLPGGAYRIPQSELDHLSSTGPSRNSSNFST